MFRTELINVADLRNESLQFEIYFSELFLPDLYFFFIFSSLFRHFTTVEEPTLNLNFDSYSTITRICSLTDHIGFYEKYFFKRGTRRKGLENCHITLHSKKDINLRSAEGLYTLCTDFHWIQSAVIGLLITKIFG